MEDISQFRPFIDYYEEKGLSNDTESSGFSPISPSSKPSTSLITSSKTCKVCSTVTLTLFGDGRVITAVYDPQSVTESFTGELYC